MREIKFRAWDKHNKRMAMRTEWKPVWIRDDKNDVYTLEARADEYELMQYTGLKDKNKKEAYEMDIIKFADGKTNEIVWRDGGFTLRFSILSCLSELTEDWEVIGNIYENPELLK